MIDLQQNTLLREIPVNLLVDEKVSSLAKALKIPINEMLDWVDKVNYKMNVDQLDESIIDHLLWESHITWHEGLSLATTKEQKINLVKSSVKLHRLKGTPAAIELVIDALNFKGKVQEWFEYEGRPYFFRLITEEALSPMTNIDGLVAMIGEFKNVRSWLENITVQRKLDLGLNIGAAYAHYQQTKILLPSFSIPDVSSLVSTGLINHSYKVTNLNIKPFEMVEEGEMQLTTALLQGNYNKTTIGLPHFAMPDSVQASSLFGGVFSVYKKTTILAKG